MQKQATKVTAANGGMHSQKAFRRIVSMLDNHGFTSPRLYHLILLDHIETCSADRFQISLKALCRQLTYRGIDYHWRACIERDEEKGLHFHVYLLVESRYVDPCQIFNTTKEGWLRAMLDRRAMTFHLSAPKASIHRTYEGKRKNYATLAGDKKADCIEWISYLAKARSKPDDMPVIHFSSRGQRRPPTTRPAFALEST